MKRIRTALTVVAVLLASCANVSQTYAPDGSRAYSIDCSGSARTWGMCLEKAGETCGTRGYDVITRTGDQGAVISGSQYGVFGGTVTTRSMVITCRSASASQRAAPSTATPQTRPMALRWDGYTGLISGTVSLLDDGRRGSIAALLPNGEGRCTGSFEYATTTTGQWSVSCTNNLSATGTFEAFGRGKGSTGQGRDSQGKLVEFTIGGTP